MKEDEFKECYFINSEMKFYTYTDFLQNCDAIKRLYDKRLTTNGKIFYKWFVYANIHLTIGQKNKAWDYLNEYCDKKELYELIRKAK